MQKIIRLNHRIAVVVVSLLGVLLAACDGNDFHLSGEVSGLVGTGLVLLNNGEDALSVNRNGAFEFDNAYTFSYPYLVTVKTQPTSPPQTCTVTNGRGRLTKDINNVQVDCKNTYTIGGTVTGLVGTGLVLQNNALENLAINVSGSFTFKTPLVDGEGFSVTILTQPSGQLCSVVEPTDSGNLSGTDITNVQVVCGNRTVGGTVTGLQNTLELTNTITDAAGVTSSSEVLTMTTNGSFTFATTLYETANYAVTVTSQPSLQICTPSNATGTISDANVTNVQISCGFSISGTVAGLQGLLVLRNNGDPATDLSISTSGSFSFQNALNPGDNYTVTVVSAPNGQSCTVSNGAGTVTTAGVTNILVSCKQGPTISVSYGFRQVVLSWDAVSGIDFYRVMKSTDGGLNFSQIGIDITTATSYADPVSVHLTDWVNTRYKVQSCTSGVCNDSNIVSGLDSAQATGYIKASNTDLGDQFGYALAISGDGNTLAVGAIFEDSAVTEGDNGAADSGAVYVFAWNGTIWGQQAYIKASNAGAGDQFGSALALSSTGDTLAIGARGEDSAATVIGGNQLDDTALNSGAVYVFTRSVTSWTQQTYVKVSNTDPGDQFGYALALARDGNTLAVGANLEDSAGTEGDNSATDSGAVYVFAWNGTIWSQQAYIKASNVEAGDQFGNALALSGVGNTLAVGARNEDGAANIAPNSGAVYVITRDVAAIWSQEAYVKASNAQSDDQFGYALALSQVGDTLVVGAIGEDSAVFLAGGGDQIDDCANPPSVNCAQNSGAAYSYTRTGTSWSQQDYVKAINGEAGDQFGYALSMNSAGDALVVGANSEDGNASGVGGDFSNNSTANSGAAYFLTNTGGAWIPTTYVKASNTGTDDAFGDALAISDDGSSLVVGATQEDSAATGVGGNQVDNSSGGSGAVYIY